MGIPSELRDMLLPNKNGVLVASPAEDRKILRSKQCTNEGVRAGFKAASIACVASAVPTHELVKTKQSVILSKDETPPPFYTGHKFTLPLNLKLAAVRMVPWAKANLNYTAQALIISAASIAAYFITADKTILECARKNAKLEDALRHNQQ